MTFAAGETTKTVIIDDGAATRTARSDEGFPVTLSNASGGATITTATATGTIQNDDVTTLAIAAASATKAEGNSGTTPFTFTVTRAGDTSGATTVTYAVTGSGANPANAADFGGTLPSGTVTFAAGETTKTVTINVVGDSTAEPDEGFLVTLSNASGGATITTATATGTIQNDDVITLAIAAASATKAEGNSGTTPFTFTVTRAGDTSGATTVNYAVTGTGANPANAADFGGTLPSGTVSFAAGETTKTVTIDVVGDSTAESDEGFLVTLSNASGGATITTATATGTIQNDDVITLAIAAASATKAEGNSGTTPFTFTVTRAGDTSGATTVTYAVTGAGVNAANAADFGGTLPSGTVSFAAGETLKTVTIDVVGDSTAEPDEGFLVTLSNASGGATITTASATGSIVNDDLGPSGPTLSISATDAVKMEGDPTRGVTFTPFTFTVTRADDTSGATTVNYAVTGSSANPATGADFLGDQLPAGQVTFNAGETSKTITINVTGDTAVELNEGFTVTLAALPGDNTTIFATASANGLIINDDAQGGLINVGGLQLNVINANVAPIALFGTASVDIFKMSDHFGIHEIVDFHRGQDVIQFSRGQFADWDDIIAHTHVDLDGNAVITYADLKVTLVGISKQEIQEHTVDFYIA